MTCTDFNLPVAHLIRGAERAVALLSQNVNHKNEWSVGAHLTASWSPAGSALHKAVRSLLASGSGARRCYRLLGTFSHRRPFSDDIATRQDLVIGRGFRWT